MKLLTFLLLFYGDLKCYKKSGFPVIELQRYTNLFILTILTVVLYIYINNCIDGVMVSMLASKVVDQVNQRL
jgi:hypothetical protein